MRILLLTHEFPPFPGGVATYCAEIACAAQDLGHDVTVVAPDYGAAPDRALDPCPGVEVMRFRGGAYDHRALVPNLLRTMRVIRAVPHDIVHAADWPCVMALGLVSRFKKIRFIATVYGTELVGPYVGRQARLLGGRNALMRAERVLAISDYTRSLLASSGLAVDPARVVVTPLGVNRFWFEPAGSAVPAARERAVAEDCMTSPHPVPPPHHARELDWCQDCARSRMPSVALPVNFHAPSDTMEKTATSTALTVTSMRV